MNQFFNMIVNTIKYRFAAISARLRYWTNANYIKTRVINRFQQWLAGLFNVKPRNKKDYYTFLGIMVSRRLAHVVILCVGLICLGYLWLVKPFQSLGSDGSIKTYKYNSWPLKFMDADVNITAKRGYIAYTGHVKGGYAQGQGELFDPDGGLVYSGEFSKNMYNGTGKQYYPNGQLQYEGDFVDNLYHGKGKLYRPGGALYYSGEFQENYQDGGARKPQSESKPAHPQGLPLRRGVYNREFEPDVLLFRFFIGHRWRVCENGVFFLISQDEQNRGH